MWSVDINRYTNTENKIIGNTFKHIKEQKYQTFLQKRISSKHLVKPRIHNIKDINIHNQTTVV